MNYKCAVCGRPLGRCAGWDLCAQCADFYKQRNIVRTRTGYQWVYPGQTIEKDMIYEKKRSIQSHREKCYYQAIKAVLPARYQLFPQVAVSAVIVRTDGTAFQSELNRVFDFLVVDRTFYPVLAIELNDSTHNARERKQRDITLARICGEAGLPLEFIECGIEQAQDQIKKALETPRQTGRKPYIFRVTNSTPVQMPVSAQPIQLEYTWGEVLCYTVLCGWMGAHRFYVDKTVTGLIYLFTLGLFGIGWIVDIIRVIFGNFTDKQGNRITRKKK